MKEILHKKRKLAESLLFILLVDVSLFFILFRGIPIFSGAVSFGNLPAFYLYGAPPISEIQELILYPLVVKLVSLFVGIVIAPSLVFFSIMFLPSFAIFLLMDELSKNKTFSILVGIAFGTPLNPLLMSQYVSGSFMIFTWLFFLSLSLALIIMFIESKKLLLLVLSAVFYALATTSGGNFPVGVYLSFPFAIGLFFVNISMRNLKFIIVNFIIYIGIAISLLLPEAIFVIFNNVSALLSTSSKNIIGGYIRRTINFEYVHYNIQRTLLDSVYISPNGFLSNIYWNILILVITISAIILIALKIKTPKSGIVKLGFFIYLFSSIIIILFHYHLLVNLFLSLGIFDQLDYPYDFIYIQQIAIIMMSVASLELFSRLILQIRSHHLTAVRLSSYAITNISQAMNKLKINSSILIVVLLTILLAFSSYPIVENAPLIFRTDQGNPFISPFYNEIHSYLIDHKETDVEMLVLPNTERELLDVGSIIQSQYIWNPPQPLPSYSNEYNITEYTKILSLPSEGNYRAFGYILALSGVKYLLVASNTNSTVLIPSGATYSTNEYLTINTSKFITSINNTSSFKLVYKANFLYLYSIISSFNTSNVSGGLATFENFPIVNVTLGNIFSNYTYANFGSYYSQYDHYNGNRSFSVEYNGSNPLGYNILYLHQAFSAKNNMSYATRNFDLKGQLNSTNTDPLYIFILLYDNVTSTMWNDTSRVNFPLIEKNQSFNFNFSIRRNIVSMNVVFYFFGNNSSTFNISNISLSETLYSQNVASNLSLQISLFQKLKSQINSTLLIPTGFKTNALFTTKIYALYNVPYIAYQKYYLYSIPDQDISRLSSNFTTYALLVSDDGPGISYICTGGETINISDSNSSIVIVPLKNMIIENNMKIYSSYPLIGLGLISINSSVHINNVQKIDLPMGKLYFYNGSIRIIMNSNSNVIQFQYEKYSLLPFFSIAVALFATRIKYRKH